MDKAKLIQAWHYANIVAGVGVALAADLTPVLAQFPKASAAVIALGIVSGSASTILTKIGQDKLLQAVVDAPTVPTPTGITIPVATVPVDPPKGA